MIVVLETNLHDVLDQWGPAGQLIGLLAHTLLPVQLLSSAEGGLMRATRQGCEGQNKYKYFLNAGKVLFHTVKIKPYK